MYRLAKKMLLEVTSIAWNEHYSFAVEFREAMDNVLRAFVNLSSVHLTKGTSRAWIGKLTETVIVPASHKE